VHGFSFANYLAELGDKAQSEIFAKSSLEAAMRDAFRKLRRFLMMAKGLTEDEAISLMSVAVDFAVTQIVDANWGIHAILKKSMFAGEAGRALRRPARGARPKSSTAVSSKPGGGVSMST
jgi:acetamidase/formamidase